MKITLCHHCGQQIVWNKTYPDKRNSHWAHVITVFNGKSHSIENALMEQRCADGRHWATPKRQIADFIELERLEKRIEELEKLCHRVADAFNAHLTCPDDAGYTADAHDALEELQRNARLVQR